MPAKAWLCWLHAGRMRLTRQSHACNLQVVCLPQLACLDLRNFVCRLEEGSPGFACAVRLTRLELAWCEFEGRWLAALSELRHLKLDLCRYSVDGEESLKSAFTSMATLQHLTSLQCFGDDGRIPATTLLQLTNLRSLIISGGCAVDEQGRPTPMPVGRWSTGLERLEVGLACALNSLPALQHMPALCSLAVLCPLGRSHGSQLIDPGLNALCAFLAKHQRQLRHLTFTALSDGPARSRHAWRSLLCLQRERPDLCVDV